MTYHPLRRRLLTVAIAAACGSPFAALAQDTAPQASESDEASVTLPTVEVTESRIYEEATGPVEGYVATRL